MCVSVRVRKCVCILLRQELRSQVQFQLFGIAILLSALAVYLHRYTLLQAFALGRCCIHIPRAAAAALFFFSFNFCDAATDSASVCACVLRFCGGAIQQHNGRFRPALPLGLKSTRAVQQRYNGSGNNSSSSIGYYTSESRLG